MKGILLVNLGSPKSTSVEDVRIYLREFLMDKRVIDVPWIIRKLIVELAILPKRPKESAKAYQSIWWDEGSPLVVISERITQKIKKSINNPVALAMRYQQPSIEKGLKELEEQGVTETLVIPLYPQYAMSTTETVVEKAKEIQKKRFPKMHLSFLPPFYKDEEYLDLLTKNIKTKLPKNFDLLIFSYHGLPERHIFKTDITKTCRLDNSCCFEKELPSHSYCYRHQCYYVTEQIKKRLGLEDSKVMQTFQSRLGKDPWLKPYTDYTLKNLSSKGIKKIAIVAPAFVSDCLETLEELAVENKEYFIENGGIEYNYLECLNEDDNWIQWLINKINNYTNN
ncbi:ferrochelatase [Apibacter muscae]|uniref:Ferrochelatase n=1 Tax=Apibacter muscae TaxID=2509004 RepID=A0A563D789_9FLAO|nr:ferrochelatase [Apibacter muscae]TWP23392.1 ferrochelatase [Apibacter muscae]TWP26086.1 ferrochelatase [Apibacter muscae]TWP27938.1 ferrochelatase [Apibacter muscae]